MSESSPRGGACALHCLVRTALTPRCPRSANVKVHDVIAEDARVNDVHKNAEVFDRKTELSFKYLQVGRARALVCSVCVGGGARRQPD